MLVIINIIIIALRIAHDEVVGHQYVNTSIHICKAKYLAYLILAKVSDEHI